MCVAMMNARRKMSDCERIGAKIHHDADASADVKKKKAHTHTHFLSLFLQITTHYNAYAVAKRLSSIS